MRRDVFQAIADPTRRKIIEVIADHPLNLNTIAETFQISRQAVSRHIKILTECRLIVIKPEGRERYCEAKLDKLGEIAAWIEPFKKSWEQNFSKLDKALTDLEAMKNNSNH